MFVVAGHCELTFADFNPYSFHMPLFFFIAGFFIASFINNAATSPAQFIKRRFRRLMLPFFVYNIIFGLLGWASQFLGLRFVTGAFAEVMSPWHLVVEPFLSNHQFPLGCALWFVPSLFCAFILIALARPLIRAALGHAWRVAALILALIGLYYCCVFINDHVPHACRYLARNVIGAIYALFGYLYYQSWLVRVRPGLVLVCGLAVYFLIASKLGHIHFTMLDNNYGSVISSYASLPTALAGIAIVLSIARMIAGPQRFVNKAGFIFLGRVSYEIMAIHITLFVVLSMILCALEWEPFSIIDNVYFRFRNCKPLYFGFALAGSCWYAAQLGKIRQGRLKTLVKYWESDPGRSRG